MQLDQRKERILAAVIEDYLETAIPVGSRQLWRSRHLDVSPATIRNEMSDLETAGYLKHPHTSAGRIPTDAGYRVYVDRLMKKKKLSSQEEKRIHQAFEEIGPDIEEVLHESLQVLSTLTDYAVVMVAPRIYHSAIKVVQMVLLNVHQAMVVLLTNTGLAKDIVLDLPVSQNEQLDQEELNRISNLLTDKLQGKTLERINTALVHLIVSEMPSYKLLLAETLTSIREHLAENSTDHVFTSGISNVLRHPEFKDNEHIQLLLKVLEHEQNLAEVLRKYTEEEGVVVKIGHENIVPEMREISVVAKSYISPEGNPLGTVGLIGPTRMLYDRSSAVIDRVAAVLEETIAEVE